MEAISKHISLQYRKNGKEYVDFVVMDKENMVKSISPRQFKYSPLPDTTTEYQENKCYDLLLADLLSKIDFARKIEFLRENITKSAKEKYNSFINN